MTAFDGIEAHAGRVFLEAWERRLKERGTMIFMMQPEQVKTLVAERRAYRLALAVWKEACPNAD